MTKSKLNILTYYYYSLFIFSGIVSLLFIKRGVTIVGEKGCDGAHLSMFALFITLTLVSSVFLNFVKFLYLKSDRILYYSLFHPLGKGLYFKEYKGIYKTTESGSGGTYEVVYLVGHDNITRFKIMGLYYKNMDDIIAAIPLPVIKRNLSGTEYLKLMFTGRANLSKIKNKKNTDSKIAFYFKVFSAVTILIFVIGMLIRILSR